MEIEKSKVHAPEIGQMWVNSPPLALGNLRGRVVLIDFWDYTCVNCIRTLPYLQEWHRRYSDKGLTIIGVHAPEFSFARRKEFVAAAVERFGIPYPVVLDNGHMIWQAFANKCWPAKYLIDKDGYIRSSILAKATTRAPRTPSGRCCARSTPWWNSARGWSRSATLAVPARRVIARRPSFTWATSAAGSATRAASSTGGSHAAGEYKLPEKIATDAFYLSGPWQSGPESVRAAADSAGEPAGLLVYYSVKEVNLVMAANGETQTVEVLQDARPLERQNAGEDVRYTESSESVVEVETPRMYNLVRNARMGQHLLQVVTRRAGLECFAFTFVSCAVNLDS